MDTKTLYDWASEAGLNFGDDDGHHDAVAVWVDAAMQSPEDLDDFWIDWVVERPERMKEMLTAVGQTDSDLQAMANSRPLRGSDTLQFAYGNSMVGRAARAGEALRRMIREGLQAYVEKHADEWWGDCIGYHSDMMEGQYEDYQYEQWKDRQLEGRE